MNNQGKILIVDIETTGFLKQGGLIVEIGFAELNLDTGESIEVYSSIVKEDKFSPAHALKPFGWIFSNSDLKYEDVDNAVSLDSEKQKIQSIIDSYPLGITAFNKNFDLPYLKSRGFKMVDLPCIMLSATPVLQIPSPYRQGEFKWPNVEEAWHYFFKESDYIEAHRASDDAVHEAKIAFELYKLKALKVAKYPFGEKRETPKPKPPRQLSLFD